MNRGRRRAVPRYGSGTLRKLDGTWVLDYRDEHGNRIRDRLSTNKREAEELRAEIIAKRNRILRGLEVAPDDVALSEIRADYLEDLKSRVSPRHYSGTKSRLDSMLKELGDPRVSELKPMQLVRIRNALVASGKSHRTANLHVDTVRAMLKWAAESGMIASNPVAHLKRLPDRPVSPRRAMTEDEIERFLAASEVDDDQCELIWDYQRVPQTPWWVTLIETGARYGELRQATWGDFDARERILVLRAETTKSRRQRVIPLRQELVDRLVKLKALHETVYCRLPKASESIFLSPEGRPWGWPTTNAMRIFHRLLKAAGIRKVDSQGRRLVLHSLRHTCASRMARSGVPIVVAQRILGHSDPKLTTQVYTHLEVEDLRVAVERVASGGDVEEKAEGVRAS